MDTITPPQGLGLSIHLSRLIKCLVVLSIFLVQNRQWLHTNTGPILVRSLTVRTTVVFIILLSFNSLVLQLKKLFLCRLLRRLATLLSQQASLMASNEAFKKQAEGASTAAKKYMEDNELLQEVCPHHTHTYTD